MIDIDQNNIIKKIHKKNYNLNSLSRISISGIFLLNKSLLYNFKIKKFDLTKLENLIKKNFTHTFPMKILKILEQKKDIEN